MIHPIPPEIMQILTALRENGYQAYPVGGCVRDRLLGFAPSDYDICTDALPEQMKVCFANGYKVYDTGIRHGTLTVVYGGMTAEVTTFRREQEYTDARHPSAVSFVTSLADDLSRRDFTVNAMALSADGEPVDLFGGRDDLAHGIIRAVGIADERFREDALRILRALRFASRLDFDIEPATAHALRDNKALLSKISRERIATELSGIVMGKAAGRITHEYLDVIAAAIPDPTALDDTLPHDEIIRLAALMLHSPAAVPTLKLANRQRDAILALINNYTRPLPHDRTQALVLLHELGLETARRLCAMRADPDAANAVEDAHKSGIPYQLHDLAVNGSHLRALGYEGAAIGDALSTALRAVMAGKVQNRKDALIAFLSTL